MFKLVDQITKSFKTIGEEAKDHNDLKGLYPHGDVTEVVEAPVLLGEALLTVDTVLQPVISSATTEHGSRGSSLDTAWQPIVTSAPIEQGSRGGGHKGGGGGFRGGRSADTLKGGETGGGPPEGKGHDGGGEEATGNNLSFPVIFPEGVTPLTLRGAMGTLILTDPYFDTPDDNGIYWFHQKAEGNEWQAHNMQWDEEEMGGRLYIDKIDLGDALESARLELNQFVRLELALLKDVGDPEVADDGWLAYNMQQIDGQGPTEVQGTPYKGTNYSMTFADEEEAFDLMGEDNITIYRSDLASVYAPAGVMSLTIQKFADGVTGADDFTGLYWDGDGWVGAEIGEKNYAANTSFGSELTVSGKVISGVSGKPFSFTEAGFYRITFEIEGGSSVYLDADTEAYNVAGARVMEIVPDYVPPEDQVDLHNGLIVLDVMVPSSVSGDEGELDSQFIAALAPVETM